MTTLAILNFCTFQNFDLFRNLEFSIIQFILKTPKFRFFNYNLFSFLSKTQRPARWIRKSRLAARAPRPGRRQRTSSGDWPSRNTSTWFFAGTWERNRQPSCWTPCACFCFFMFLFFLCFLKARQRFLGRFFSRPKNCWRALWRIFYQNVFILMFFWKFQKNILLTHFAPNPGPMNFGLSNTGRGRCRCTRQSKRCAGWSAAFSSRRNTPSACWCQRASRSRSRGCCTGFLWLGARNTC